MRSCKKVKGEDGKLLTYSQVVVLTGIPYATVRTWFLDKGLTTVAEMVARRNDPHLSGGSWECEKDKTGERGFNKTKCCLRSKGTDKCKNYFAMTETWAGNQPLPEVCNEARGNTCPNFDTGRDW